MKYELTLLLKQRSIISLLLLSLLLTGFSLFNGWQNISHINAQINHAQHEETLRKQDFFIHHSHDGPSGTERTVDAGELGYYLFHTVYHTPGEWSFIALGNRLVIPYVQRIRLLGLQGQLYDGESHHPEYVMLGSFDYAFLLVFFAPLLCIALTHDLKASEQQAQRLLFLQSLMTTPRHFWGKRVLSRWLLITLTFVLPVLLFAAIHTLSPEPLLRVVAITALYTFLWSVLCAAFSLRKRALNANFNAMLLTSIWLMLCVVLPNLSQLWLHDRYPLQDGSQIALQHRQWVHSAWDLPKDDTLTPFYALYPQWKDTPPVTGRFHWKWYFAFQHMADVKLQPQVTAREQTLRQRDQATSLLAWVLPTVWVQRNLEEIAQSNVTHLLAHRTRIERFHTVLRHAAYPFVFEERPLTAQDFLHMPTFGSTGAD
jgi:ABC-2 type transport system permease protein